MAEHIVYLGPHKDIAEKLSCYYLGAEDGKYANVRLLSNSRDYPWLKKGDVITMPRERVEQLPQCICLEYIGDNGPCPRHDEQECGCVLPEQSCPACRAAATVGLADDEIPFGGK